MRTIIFIILLSPLLVFAQKTNVFFKLTDARGQQITGDASVKGFERSIEVTSFSSTPGKENNEINFTMPVGAAGADLRRALSSGELLNNGLLTVQSPNGIGAPAVQYTIKMESISVLSCTEAMGCNNVMNTTVTLKATRAGWTYYSQNRSGVSTVSRKFGWDASTGAEWTNF